MTSVTSVAPTGLLLVGSHRAGQPHLENRIIWSRFLYIAGYVQPIIIIQRRLSLRRVTLFGRLGLLALVNLGFGLFHLRSESRSLMEARFIVGGLARCFLLASGGTRALALQPLVAGHVRFVLLDCLIHLMGVKGPHLAISESSTCRISCRTPFKETSYWRDSNSACESWPCQSLSRLLMEVPTLIIKSVASSCAP